jgi:hypothetical protein
LFAGRRILPFRIASLLLEFFFSRIHVRAPVFVATGKPPYFPVASLNEPLTQHVQKRKRK